MSYLNFHISPEMYPVTYSRHSDSLSVTLKHDCCIRISILTPKGKSLKPWHLARTWFLARYHLNRHSCLTWCLQKSRENTKMLNSLHFQNWYSRWGRRFYFKVAAESFPSWDNVYFWSHEQIAYFLTQEAVYFLVHFKFLRVYGAIHEIVAMRMKGAFLHKLPISVSWTMTSNPALSQNLTSLLW